MISTSVQIPLPSVREYGAKVIREALDKMLSISDAVRDASDIEAIHDMRVASRRLRAAIAVFGSPFACKEFDRFERDVKAVTRELGAARDLDVIIDALEKMESTLPAEQQSGVDGFVEEKRVQRTKLQRDVVKALDRIEDRNLPERFEQIVRFTAPATAADDSGAQEAASVHLPQRTDGVS